MCSFWFPGIGLVGGGGSFVYCLCKFNVCILGRPAVMVSAILAARHRNFVLVVTSLFVLFVFPMHNKFLLLLHYDPHIWRCVVDQRMAVACSLAPTSVSVIAHYR